MSEIDPSATNQPDPNDPNVPDASATVPAPAPKPKKKRRLLKVIAVLVVLLVLLVICAPYIAGTAPVRAIVVSQINNNLNGSVVIDDYSVGWTGGIKASGIKVYDQQKTLLLSVPRVSTQLSLLSAIGGNLNLGDTVVDVNLDKIVVDKDGNVNLAGLARQQVAEKKPATPKKSDAKDNEIELPKISGRFTVNILGGSVEGAGVPAPITINPSTIVLNVPDINRPITNDVKLAYRVGDSRPSTISISGSIDAVKDGKIDMDQVATTLKAQQKITLQDLDTSAASAFVPNGEVAGIVNGTLDVNAQGITGISANGEFIATDFAFAGAGLPDRLRLKQISIPIQVTRTVVDANTTLIKIEKLAVNSSLVNFTVSGEVPEQALQNLADKKAPGVEGQIDLKLSVPDFGALAKALPNTLKLQEGVTIETGSLTNVETIKFNTDSVVVTQKLDVVATGTRDGKKIQLSPVNLATNATLIPNGKDIPDIRKLNLALTSAFATITGGGDSIAKIDIDGKFDLAKLQSELAQFIDLQGKQFAGTGQFTIKTNGDVTDNAAPIGADVNVNLSNIRIAGVANQPIDLSRIALTAGGQLQRDAGGKPQAINNGTLNFQSGDAKSPLVNVVASATIGGLDSGTMTVPAFKLAKFEVNNLADVQRQFGGLISALAERGIELKSGAVYANVAGKFDGNTITLDEPLAFSMPNIVVNKNGQPVFGREDITGKVAGKITICDDIVANLSELSVGAKSELFAINSSEPVNVTLAKSGGVAGNGVIKLGADVARLSSIARAFGGAVQVSNEAGQITSGRFDGTLKLAQTKDTAISFDGKIVNLTISSNDKPITNETVTITLDAIATGDMKGVNVKAARVASSFANADVADAKLKLEGAPLEMVQQANVDVDVPNLSAVYGLINAFTPKATASSEQSIAPPTLLLAMQKKPNPADATAVNLDPLQVTGGSAKLKLTVNRPDGANQTNVSLSEMQVSNLAIARGKQKYAFAQDIDMKLAASLSNRGDQIDRISVDQLSGDLGGVARLAMPDKLAVTGPMDKPNANGSIKLDGTIDALVPLLAVLQGAEPLPYSGEYLMTQKISTSQASDGVTINVVGNFSAPRFSIKEGGKTAFEDAIELKNDLSANLDTRSAEIKTLNIAMPRSNALTVNVVGGVSDWEQKRTIKGAKVDLAYDLATLWKIVFPMLSPEMQEQYKLMKVAGKASRTFNVSGAFPNKPTVYESFRSLNADGGFAVELLDLPQGVTAQMIDLPFKIAGGVLTTQAGKIGERPPTPEDSNDGKANGSGLAGLLGGGNRRSAADEPAGGSAKPPVNLKPENGYANTGALNLAGITIDLTTPNLNVTIPKDKQILQQVRLNPVLADSLGKIGAVLFVGSSKAEGLINLRVAQFNRVPIGDLTSRDRHANATLVLNVDDVKLSGIVTSVLAQVLGADAITGRIPDSTVTISNGQASTNLTVMIDKEIDDPKTGKRVLQGQPMKFNGAVNLADLKLRDFVVDIAPGLIVRDLRKYFPNGVALPLRGIASSPQIDLQKAIAENAVKGLIPGGDKGDGKPGLGDLIPGLGGNKHKDKDKKKRGR
ncbi:hypothetical protein BH09PLA1_BH09PLA1_08610 [soil metagenome]